MKSYINSSFISGWLKYTFFGNSDPKFFISLEEIGLEDLPKKCLNPKVFFTSVKAMSQNFSALYLVAYSILLAPISA